MARKTIREMTNDAIEHEKVANYYMRYNENYYNLIPISANRQLFLSIVEDDFIFDGFRVSQFKDVKKMRIKNDKCDEIIRNEGLFKGLHVPDIDLENWKTVFEGLKALGKSIIVEYETAEGIDDSVTIGRIERVYKSCLYMYSFDADGIWDTEPYRIPYNEVTSATFGSRYINVFTKHIEPGPNV